MKISYLINIIIFWIIFIKTKFINFIKNNLYLDFFLKLFLKKFVYNFFIILAFFFAEKYIIEWNTKYVYIYLTYNFMNFFKKIKITNMFIFITFFLLNLIFLFL